MNQLRIFQIGSFTSVTKFLKKMNLHFLKREFECLVHVSLYGEPEPLVFPSPQTLADRDAPQIEEEKPTTPFVPYPPPFSIPM